jgi:hypothetical protein
MVGNSSYQKLLGIRSLESLQDVAKSHSAWPHISAMITCILPRAAHLVFSIMATLATCIAADLTESKLTIGHDGHVVQVWTGGCAP